MRREAGSRRQELVFEYFGATSPLTRNSTGEVVEVWATAFTMRGSFQVVGSREFPAYRKIYTDTAGRFLMDYRAELVAPRAPEQYRIRWNGQVWNISPPAYDNMMREMTIEVTSMVEPK